MYIYFFCKGTSSHCLSRHYTNRWALTFMCLYFHVLLLSFDGFLDDSKGRGKLYILQKQYVHNAEMSIIFYDPIFISCGMPWTWNVCVLSSSFPIFLLKLKIYRKIVLLKNIIDFHSHSTFEIFVAFMNCVDVMCV